MITVQTLIETIINREGGIADVGDGKGVTRYGQTPAWLEEFKLEPPETPSHARANYIEWLLTTGLCDVLVNTTRVQRADSLAGIVIDIAVMSDHRKAIKALQACLHITVDGVMGPDTRAALFSCDRLQLARQVIAWDMEYQAALIATDPAKRARWAKGWAHRLAEHVRQLD